MNVNFPLLAQRLKKRIFGAERPGFRAHEDRFRGKIGLEIGGPSKIFRRNDFLPLYPLAGRVDGVNFSAHTTWEGRIVEGSTYQYAPKRFGHQFVCEGNKLDPIPDRTYDFVVSSHSLEHSANPLRAIAEWKRVTKPRGALLLVLPDRRFTFDHRRPVTPFEHLLDDFRKDVGEDDLTHVDEILSLHDLSMDPKAGSAEDFRARSSRNYENRCLHQHVFDHALVARMFSHFSIELAYEDMAPPFHVISMGIFP